MRQLVVKDILVKHALWIGLVVAGLIVGGVTSIRLVDTLATVVVICALLIGYFIEANALVDQAPRRFPVFAALTGALAGALIGLMNHAGKWFKGYSGVDVENVSIWTIGGGVVGAVLGLLVATRFVAGRERPVPVLVMGAVIGAVVGAPIGGINHVTEWFVGYDGVDLTVPVWPLGGAAVGAVLGGLLGWRFPPSDERRHRIPDRARPAIFVLPALFFLAVTLVIPTLQTIYLSFRNDDGDQSVGTRNYRDIFESDAIFTLDGLGNVVTSRLFIVGVVIGAVALGFVIFRGTSTRRGVDLSAPLPVVSLTTTAILVLLAMVGALRGVVWNNVFWITFVTALSTIFGLAIAVLADRSRGESVAKSLIFMPMAISFVGASIIWRFVYFWNASGDQIGLLNAVWTGLGGEPQTWIQNRPWNDLLLIAIMIWIQTGFAMVVLSSAIKGVPTELLEAARVDGASEGQTFWRITVPHIRSTIAVVVTTLIITVLKVYDIVKVMTDGEFDTNVIANQMFNERFINGDRGMASALAVLLFAAVVPLMIINVRRLRRAEAEAR